MVVTGEHRAGGIVPLHRPRRYRAGGSSLRGRSRSLLDDTVGAVLLRVMITVAGHHRTVGLFDRLTGMDRESRALRVHALGDQVAARHLHRAVQDLAAALLNLLDRTVHVVHLGVEQPGRRRGYLGRLVDAP